MKPILPSQKELLSVIIKNCLAQKPHREIDWEHFNQFLFSHEISMEKAMQYLHINQPEVAGFEEWILEHSNTTQIKTTETIDDVLSEEDLIFWKKNGYVVVQNAISRHDCLATQDAIAEFLAIQLSNPETWYGTHEAMEGLMVLFTDHSTLHKNRASLKIKKAFEQLYGHDQLYKTIDKVSFNPPEYNQYTFRGSPLHWDVSLQLPIPDKFQGLLYLTDVPSHGGAFQCVPGFHLSIAEWLQALPTGADPGSIAATELLPVPIPGNAGDFIIWHQALPHGASPNKHNQPRMVQYLTYLPL